MGHSRFFSVLPLLAVMVVQEPCPAEETTRHVSTDLSAMAVYDAGQARGVMRAADRKSVVLDNLQLIENDAPGAGLSEKGTYSQAIYKGVLARKTLTIADPRAQAAHVVLYMTAEKPANPPPYYLMVNGHRIEGNPVPWHESVWHWVEVPVGDLVAGANEVVLGCDAPEGEGYDLLFARDDEYERGGGKLTYNGNSSFIASCQVDVLTDSLPAGFARIEVGKTSAISTDSGTTWSAGKLGPKLDVAGEYTIRLSLQRYHDAGILVTAPIDLWGEMRDYAWLSPRCSVAHVALHGSGDVPSETDLEWAVRFADTPDVLSTTWGDYSVIAHGVGLEASVDSAQNRYMQARVRLISQSPLATPSFRDLRVERDLAFRAPPANTFYLRSIANPEVRYSSYAMTWEHADAADLDAIRKRLGLDGVIAGADGDFEIINRVRHHVSQLWFHKLPYPEYPEWSALTILDRNQKYGWGGMCMQFVVVFTQALQSLGYQARHVSLFNHETVEVYVDQLAKWVLVDPESVFDSYEFNTETGEPLNALDQHRYFLQRYGFTAQRPIPWMSPTAWCNWPIGIAEPVPETPQPLEISTATDWINDPDPLKRPPQHNLAGFFRIIPRADFLSRPTPRPLNNGSTYWPWGGFLCWYDDATPRKLQHALQSDREADFYPTLNRVAFTAVHGEHLGDVDVYMTTQTPNFESYEVNIDGAGWKDCGDHVVWTLHPSAVNRIEMRVRNKRGVQGKASHLELYWHYREPFRPRLGV